MRAYRDSAALSFFLVALCPGATGAAAPEPQSIAVESVREAPVVDGDLREWGADGWHRIAIRPAVQPHERERLGLEPADRNYTGSIVVLAKAVAARGRLFLAFRWPDDAPDLDYRPWEWRGDRYAEGQRRDDMFAVRFHRDGDYDRSMLSDKTYSVDVWLWSAGRSNPSGYAEDLVHSFGMRPVEDAAEYEVAGKGTVYIRKIKDAGTPVYRNTRPANRHQGDRLPSIAANEAPSGSAADVSARGVWAAGHWSLELSRKLDTGHADDVAFRPAARLLAQIAVFNRSNAEHKSISEPLLLVFPATF